MIENILSCFAIICIAIIVGQLVSKLKLPAILGWLLTGIIFGPYLVQIVSLDVINSEAYKIYVHFFECFAGVMIGKEIIFKKLKSSGKQIIGITFVQSIMTFLFVSLVFSIIFLIVDIPIYLGFIFGAIALATAPAPVLSIVNEYHTSGPITRTLIPLAAIDDVIGVVVFFSVMSIITSVKGEGNVEAVFLNIASVILPFVIGIALGFLCSLILKKVNNSKLQLLLLVVFLCLSTVSGLLIDKFLFGKSSLNYLLIGMAFSSTIVNLIPEEKLEEMFKFYAPVLNLSLIIVIVNLGMPLDYKLIAGAGVYTAVYICSRACGKIGGAYLGGVITHAEPKVKKYLGLTLLPHSGVSLIFTGIAVDTLNKIEPELSAILSGTIVAAAIINEIIAVIVAKLAFKVSGEIETKAN